MFDVVIEGRMVVDGTEAPAWRVDVDVKGDQIADCCDSVSLHTNVGSPGCSLGPINHHTALNDNIELSTVLPKC